MTFQNHLLKLYSYRNINRSKKIVMQDFFNIMQPSSSLQCYWDFKVNLITSFQFNALFLLKKIENIADAICKEKKFE